MSPHLPLDVINVILQHLAQDLYRDHRRVHPDLRSASLAHSSCLHPACTLMIGSLAVGVRTSLGDPVVEQHATACSVKQTGELRSIMKAMIVDTMTAYPQAAKFNGVLACVLKIESTTSSAHI
jgi:hypothetical protein